MVAPSRLSSSFRHNTQSFMQEALRAGPKSVFGLYHVFSIRKPEYDEYVAQRNLQNSFFAASESFSYLMSTCKSWGGSEPLHYIINKFPKKMLFLKGSGIVIIVFGILYDHDHDQVLYADYLDSDHRW